MGDRENAEPAYVHLIATTRPLHSSVSERSTATVWQASTTAIEILDGAAIESCSARPVENPPQTHGVDDIGNLVVLDDFSHEN